MSDKKYHIIPADWLEEKLNVIPTDNYEMGYKDAFSDLKNMFPTVEMPTDEELHNEAESYRNTIGNKDGTAHFDFYKGAKYIIDKLLKQKQ